MDFVQYTVVVDYLDYFQAFVINQKFVVMTRGSFDEFEYYDDLTDFSPSFCNFKIKILIKTGFTV